MVKKEYKPTMLTLESYNILDKARKELGSKSASRVTFNDVIKEFVKKRLIVEELDTAIRDYIYGFIDSIKNTNELKGAVLFGSVAKGTYNKYSDIDMFLVTKGNESEFYNKCVKPAINSLESEQDKLIKKDLYLNISPLIISINKLDNFSPVFFDVLDYGIILYDNDDTIKNFFVSLRKIKHRRLNIGGTEVVEWK